MNNYHLLLGSNLGNRALFLKKACDELKLRGLIVKSSCVYETEPWGMKSNRTFFNMAIAYQVDLSPIELLDFVQKIENKLGREAKEGIEGYKDRNIDIDILLNADEIYESSRLTIPHKELINRDFALIPLAEIAGNCIHPVQKLNITALINKYNNVKTVKKLASLARIVTGHVSD